MGSIYNTTDIDVTVYRGNVVFGLLEGVDASGNDFKRRIFEHDLVLITSTFCLDIIIELFENSGTSLANKPLIGNGLF